ncbi:hypothetical protein Tco_0245936 [Tanacetum coccineum]
MAPLIVQIWTRSGFDEIKEFLGCLKDCQFCRRPYREGFGAFAWRIPILVTVSKTVLRHSKLFEGFKVQLGEDPIQARRGGLRARGEELSAKQAFWLKHSNYNPDTSVKSHTPVRIEAPSELPRVSLVNESLKKLKYQLASFDKVVKMRTTSGAITAEIVHIAMNYVDSLDVKKSRVNDCNKCLELKTELLKKKDLIEKDVYDKLLKTRSQEKDTVIRKLKDMIKSLSGKDSVENVKKDIDEIETISIELEHSVAKLLSENENSRKE